MAELMKKCQLSIVSASSLLYEIAAVGLGCITGYYAENQIKPACYASDTGIAVNIGNWLQIDLSSIVSLIKSINIEEQIIQQKRMLQPGIEKNFLRAFAQLKDKP